MRFSQSSVSVLALIALVSLAAGCGGPDTPTGAPSPEPMVELAALPDSLVTTEWLAAHLDDPDLVVLDCTVKGGPGREWSTRGGKRAPRV